MIVQFPTTGLRPAALQQRSRTTMKVILHTGAHRCATTSFQEYMRQNAQPLACQGIGFWGPYRTRGGALFHGIQPGPALRGTVPNSGYNDDNRQDVITGQVYYVDIR